MSDTGREPMTFQELLQATGASENALRTALEQTGQKDMANRDRADRRRIVYPEGTLEKVNKWLDTH